MSAEAAAAIRAAFANEAEKRRKAEEVLGYSFELEVDRVEDEPPEFGEVTASEIVEAGRLGYRGREAVEVAASRHRESEHRESDGADLLNRVRRNASIPKTGRTVQRPRERRATRSTRASRASPGDPDLPPPLDGPERRCAACGAPLEGRRPQTKTCGNACRVRKHRTGLWPTRFKDAEEALTALVGKGETCPEDALDRIVTAWSLVS